MQTTDYKLLITRRSVTAVTATLKAYSDSN